MMLLRLLKALDQEKYEISLITLKSGGALEKEISDLGISLISAEMNSISGTVKGFSKIRSILNKIHPHIVFCWMYHANLIGGLAAKSCHVRKIYWNIRNSGLRQMWKAPITALVIKIGALFSDFIPDLIFVNSDQARDNHILMGYKEIRMRVIHNGIDTSVFQPDPEARRIIRKELKLRPSASLVGMVARFHPQKDHKTFIEAAYLIKNKIPEIQFVLCGTGIENSNNELASWITKSGLEGNVSLLGERRDIPNLMCALDLLMLSSAYGESFPNVLAEAMSCGVPCAATDVGGSAFIIGDTGMIVPPKNPRALADAAINLLANSDLRIKLGKAARSRIINEFSIEKIAAKFEDYLST